jgi:uncharacterized protein YndB with AHSA1/START domain
MKKYPEALATLTILAAPALAQDRPPPIVFRAEIAAPPAEVWRALATRDGVRSFFAGAARVEPRVDGPYEIYFMPGNPLGLRGGEGDRVLALEENRRLMASWNAPPAFGPLRDQHTIIEFDLTPLPDGHSLVTATHSGWGRGDGWAALRTYFETAWPVVLGRLQYRFDHGPVDWSRPPDGAAYFHARP